MFIIRDPTGWLLDVVEKFPVAVRPGMFIALALLICWILLRRRNSLATRILRVACIATDVSIGLVLLAEYRWTHHRRHQGKPAAELAIVGGGVAERMLDGVADLYGSRRPSAVAGHWRTPIIWGILICAVSILLYRLQLHTPSNGSTTLAAHVWHYWSSFSNWARGR